MREESGGQSGRQPSPPHTSMISPVRKKLAIWRWCATERRGRSWGSPTMSRTGGRLPGARIDLRKVARAEAGGNVGAPADYLARLGGDPSVVARMGHGRAGLRVAQLAAIAGILAK